MRGRRRIPEFGGVYTRAQCQLQIAADFDRLRPRHDRSSPLSRSIQPPTVSTARAKSPIGCPVRRTNYRLVLPEGALRRFRLPESFGDEVRGNQQGHRMPAVAALGWIGLCACSWSLAVGIFDPGALLGQTWQLPSDGSGRMLVAGVLAGTQTDRRTPASSLRANERQVNLPVAARGALQAPPSVARTPLPKVTFPNVQAHRGGWGGVTESSPNGAAGLTPADVGGTSVEDVGRPTLAGVSERSGAEGVNADADFNLGRMVRDLVADSPGALPKPTAPSQTDPFEADFGPASLPQLNSARVADAPIALRPREASSRDSGQPSRDGVAVPPAAPFGERGAVSWNGGCQRAFDASVQHIGDKPAAKDASRADYTRVLGRLDVARCGPRAHTSIEMCVAVSGGHAIGATVDTTPSSPALGECLLRQVRGLGFPASGGTDLVRTHYEVE